MPIGAVAEFRCHHETADIIRWRLNGSLARPSGLPAGISISRVNNVDILAITAQAEYSGTQVVCVARFDSGASDEESAAAILTGRYNNFELKCIGTIQFHQCTCGSM